MRDDLLKIVARGTDKGDRAAAQMADWSRRFIDPIILPDGRELRTLREAADFITALPPREHDRPQWRGAPAMRMVGFYVDLNQTRIAKPRTVLRHGMAAH